IRDAGPGFRDSHRLPFGHAVLDALGIEADELREALAEGRTLAEIADANGSSAEALDDALVADAEARLAEAGEDGRLTEGQADERLAELREHLGAVVTGDAPAFPGRHRGAGGPGGPGGFGFGFGSGPHEHHHDAPADDTVGS